MRCVKVEDSGAHQELFGIAYLKNTCGCTICACSVNRQPGYRVWIIEMDIQIRIPDIEIHTAQSRYEIHILQWTLGRPDKKSRR